MIPTILLGGVVSDTVSSDFVRLDGAVSAVRVLHSKREFNGDGYGWSVCAECRQAWPCATERAIADVLAGQDPS